MEEMEWLGWLCAFMLILHGLRVVQTPLRGGCKTQPHHLLVTNHFASLQGLRDELRPWGETGGNSRGRVGAGGGMLGGEGSCPSTQSQKSLSQVWRSVEGEPSLPSSGEALCFQVPSGAFGSFSPHVLIPLGCCGRPSPGSRLRILGGGTTTPSCHPPPFTATCLPRALQTGTAGDDGQVVVTSGFVTLASPRGQTGPPVTGDCCQRSSLFFLPKPLSFSSPATSSPLSPPHVFIPIFILSKTWSCQD